MIVYIDDQAWKEYQRAERELSDHREEKRTHSFYATSMRHVELIERKAKAKEKLLTSIRAIRTSDRPELFAAADSVRASHPSVKERTSAPPKVSPISLDGESVEVLKR